MCAFRFLCGGGGAALGGPRLLRPSKPILSPTTPIAQLTDYECVCVTSMSALSSPERLAVLPQKRKREAARKTTPPRAPGRRCRPQAAQRTRRKARNSRTCSSARSRAPSRARFERNCSRPRPPARGACLPTTGPPASRRRSWQPPRPPARPSWSGCGARARAPAVCWRRRSAVVARRRPSPPLSNDAQQLSTRPVIRAAGPPGRQRHGRGPRLRRRVRARAARPRLRPAAAAPPPPHRRAICAAR